MPPTSGVMAEVSLAPPYPELSLVTEVCVFITAGPITKLCAWGRRRVEDMCYEIRRAEVSAVARTSFLSLFFKKKIFFEKRFEDGVLSWGRQAHVHGVLR